VTSQDLLTDRYGAPAPWRRFVLIGVCVAVSVAFLGWLGWTTWDHATPDVQSQLVSYDVVDEHSAKAVVEVHLADDGVQATCTLQAFAEDHTQVGALSFQPSAESTRYEEVIRTERRATSIDLAGCTTPGQPRPR
jgi:hypothetical protein